MCHVFVRGDSLAAVAVSDHDYPPRVAHTMLTRCHFNLFEPSDLKKKKLKWSVWGIGATY